MPFNKTKIRWCDRNHNAVWGCSKSGSPGCAQCFAERVSTKFGHTEKPWLDAYAEENITIKRDYLDDQLGKPAWVFVNSMSDMYHPLVPDDFVFDYYDRVCSRLDDSAFLILTKHGTDDRVCNRCGRAYPFGTEACESCDGTPLVTRSESITSAGSADDEYDPANARAIGHPPDNVMLGVSVGHPAWRYRIDWLRDQPAATTFVSFEPLVAEIDSVDLSGIDWAIIGGESGPNYRVMEPAWARSLIHSCWAQDTAVFFKQHSDVKTETRQTIRMDGENRRIEEFPDLPVGVLPKPQKHISEPAPPTNA